MANHRRSLEKESYWRRELAKRDKEIGSRSTRPAGLMAVDVIPSAGEVNLEIEVADGVVIRLREGASAETLARVLAVACAQGSDQVKSC